MGRWVKGAGQERGRVVEGDGSGSGQGEVVSRVVSGGGGGGGGL